jgi:Flp pilus assembly pilin Flp
VLPVWTAIESRRVSGECGVTTAEYAVVAALLVIVAILGGVLLGAQVDHHFTDIGTP